MKKICFNQDKSLFLFPIKQTQSGQSRADMAAPDPRLLSGDNPSPSPDLGLCLHILDGYESPSRHI